MADELGLSFPASAVEAQGAVRTVSAYRTAVDSLRLGDAAIAGVPVIVVDSSDLTFKLPGLVPFLKIDGIVGLPLLRQFDVEFAFEDNSFSLTLPPTHRPPEPFAGNFHLVDNKMLLPATIDEAGPFTFLLDTGADCGCTITPACLKELQDKNFRTTNGSGGFVWGVGGGKMGRFPGVENVTMRLPSVDVKNANLYVGGGTGSERSDKLVTTDGLITKTILDRSTLHIDFHNMRLSVTD